MYSFFITLTATGNCDAFTLASLTCEKLPEPIVLMKSKVFKEIEGSGEDGPLAITIGDAVPWWLRVQLCPMFLLLKPVRTIDVMATQGEIMIYEKRR